jgi:integrase/recombinase XerD
MATAGWANRQMLDRYAAATRAERAADEARRLGLGNL